MRKLILLMLIGMITSLIQAQNENDALRYSFLTHGGTARYVGMSGAFGALGADFSSLSTNPAGIGSFRSSSIMFSPTFEMNNVEASYKNTNTNSGLPYVNMNNFGIVFNFLSSDNETSGWTSAGLALGYNKLRSFNQDITIKGFNTKSSRLDQFMINSDGLLPNELYSSEYVAYRAKLIDTISNSNYLYFHDYYGNYQINQKKRIITTGGIGEYVIGIGGNYNNVFQIGVSMGYQNIRYKEQSTFSENSDITELISFDYTENLETKGTGINFKLGMIYRPVEFLRFGLAFHTPTYYTLTDNFSYEASSIFSTARSDGKKEHTEKGDGEMNYTYDLYTPMRIITSAAIVIQKIGIISADYEYVKYNNARLKAEDYDFEPENDSIGNLFKDGHNLRLGAEIKLNPIYLRAGVSYYGSPDKEGNIGAIKSFSCGLGLRSKKSFIDFAFNHSNSDLKYRMYDYETGTEYSNLKYNNNTIVVTLGYVF